MSIEGRIAIDVSFADSATSSGVQSLKKISLAETTSYTTGKVAIVTGTCGTAAVTVNYTPTTYRNADGEFVSLSPQRLAFAATPAASLYTLQSDGSEASPSNSFCWSFGGRPVVLEKALPDLVVTTAGTASYTLVLYGT